MRPVIRFLLALWIGIGLPCPASAETPKAMTTIVIVARDTLPDPNFRNSAVLVMNHIGPAPVGLIMNRPTRIPVSRLFPNIERLAQLDDKIYFGGPVDAASVSFLFRADAPPGRATQVLEGVYISTDNELLRTLLRRDKPMEGLRIFVGYSGWASGQLEAEIGRGDWRLAPADNDAIFGRNAEHPWPERDMPDVGGRTSWRNRAVFAADMI